MILWCYFPKETTITNIQLHGFSDPSESVYAEVVYLKNVIVNDHSYVSLVIAPIKRLTIQCLDICRVMAMATSVSHYLGYSTFL